MTAAVIADLGSNILGDTYQVAHQILRRLSGEVRIPVEYFT